MIKHTSRVLLIMALAACVPWRAFQFQPEPTVELPPEEEVTPSPEIPPEVTTCTLSSECATAYCELGLCATLPSTAPGSPTPSDPVLFFSDLTSAPGSGGENGRGAYVRLFGERFGPYDAQSSKVLLGNVEVPIISWTEDGAFARGLDMIVVQLGPEHTSGTLVVRSGARRSNALMLAVHSGRIRYLGGSGADDSNDGATLATPWASFAKARGSVIPGDIVYLRGTFSAREDVFGQNAYFREDSALPSPSVSGSSTAPIAFVGHPSESARIAPDDGPDTTGFGIYARANVPHDIVFANLSIEGVGTGVSLSGTRHRLVNMHIKNADNDGVMISATSPTAETSELTLLGVQVSQSPFGFRVVTYDDVDGGISGVEVAYSECNGQTGCAVGALIEVSGTSDNPQTTGIRGVSFHHNLLGGRLEIGDEYLSDLTFQDSLFVYSPPGTSNAAFLGTRGARALITQSAPVPRLVHNTFIDLSSNAQPFVSVSFANARSGVLTMERNVIHRPSATELGFAPSSLAALSYALNLWDVPASVTVPAADAALKLGAGFVDAANDDYRLLPASPAVDAAPAPSTSTFDYLGVRRPQGTATDLGAFELTQP